MLALWSCADGTVEPIKLNKNHRSKTDLYAQGYFAYDLKKSGGVTVLT